MPKKKRVPPVSTFRHMLERARRSCLRLPDGLAPPGEEKEREIALEEVSLGDEREEGDRTSHLLIESDNLHALNLMTKTHKGMIDLIYIDPPYNTGRMDLGYKDRWEPEEWIAFMFPRLYLAKDSRMDPGALRQMYPRLAEFREIRETMDPGRVIQSDLARRLGL